MRQPIEEIAAACRHRLDAIDGRHVAARLLEGLVATEDAARHGRRERVESTHFFELPWSSVVDVVWVEACIGIEVGEV